MFSLFLSFAPFWPLSILLKTSLSPWTSFWVSSMLSSKSSFFSSSLNSSFTAVDLASVITLWFGQSEAMCRSPWHLKHLLLLTGLGLGLFWGAWIFCRAWVLCGKEGDGFGSLEMGLELPLLKAWFRVKSLGYWGLGGCLDFFCCSTL